MFVRNADAVDDDDVNSCDIAKIVRCYDNGTSSALNPSYCSFF